MAFSGEVRPGQFFEVSIPKFGEAPISVSGIMPGKSVDLTIRRVGVVTNEVFERSEGQHLLLRGPYGNGFDLSLFERGEVVVVAGGTGVSPVRGVIDALAGAVDAADKHVIVGFRSPDDLLFCDDLKRWGQALDLTLTVDGAPEGYEGNIGLVTAYIPRPAAQRPCECAGRGRRAPADDAFHDYGPAQAGPLGVQHLGLPGAADVLWAGQVWPLPHQGQVRVPGWAGVQLYRVKGHARLGGDAS